MLYSCCNAPTISLYIIFVYQICCVQKWKDHTYVAEGRSDVWIKLYLCGIIFNSKAEGFGCYRDVVFILQLQEPLKFFLQQWLCSDVVRETTFMSYS